MGREFQSSGGNFFGYDWISRSKKARVGKADDKFGCNQRAGQVSETNGAVEGQVPVDQIEE